ncbi:alpha/beta hydrolase domain-containing protein [Nocardioides sp. SOB77]|uniref:Alpha/beta hydrolase domain-containing protein n=1 Tax=Nocardioides oceani TaxID=3058369 RepID=A0ABT8FIC0_9ACTN|nr:alpha/beta hydrolase domain-containing protein [Nocardioides oceani]MDN4174215.1 alpha/beta hydrolase domain-containing protein [Nocardioides oceani]
MATTLTTLPPGEHGLLAARPGPDLAAAGYAESELVAAGSARSFAADDLPQDGRWTLAGRDRADFATRVVLRAPADPATYSGTLVVEWLNVSSGTDAAPDWTYLADEVVRRGHAWAGVSAQHIGVMGGVSAVGLGAPTAGLRGQERYAALHHPGDAYAYDVFTEVAGALVEHLGATLGEVTCLLAIGESQSAYALTTYVDGVQPLTGRFDGFLVHSRGGAAMPLGEPGEAVDIASFRLGAPTHVRADVAVPVVVVQTETDLTGRLAYLPARQPDAERVRLWEVAGTAHADKFQIGDFEEYLTCPRPVNRGQQAYVVRAALRHLETWARGGPAAPSAARLEVEDGRFVLDGSGNARGGIRTPAVDAPTQVLAGDTEPGAPAICELFGSTLPLAPGRVAELYADVASYLQAYERATDAAIAAGFVLADDRDELLAEARPDLVEEGLATGSLRPPSAGR